jgi:hypothetical protein
MRLKEDAIAAVIQPVLLLHTNTGQENIPLQHSESHILILGVTLENPFEERESTDTRRTWNTNSSPPLFGRKVRTAIQLP